MEVTHAVKGWDSFLAHKPQPTTSFDQFGVDDAINAIFSWVSDSSTPLLIMWVHDDNKTKTSFIAQVVAQLLEKRGRLSASYFFNENTDADSVVPTLVYDLVMQDHDDGLLRDEVSRVIDRYSGKVFDSTCREQFNRLLVAPVEAVSKLYRGQSHRPLQGDLILLHAFEDCNDEFGFHETFLSALLQALLTIKETLFSQRLLIIGRRTNRLEKFLTIGQPILQRPVQSRHWLKGEKNISQEIVESTRRVDKMRRSFTELNLGAWSDINGCGDANFRGKPFRLRCRPRLFLSCRKSKIPISLSRSSPTGVLGRLLKSHPVKSSALQRWDLIS